MVTTLLPLGRARNATDGCCRIVIPKMVDFFNFFKNAMCARLMKPPANKKHLLGSLSGRPVQGTGFFMR